MASAIQIATAEAIRRIQRLQTITIAWMSVEAVVSLFAAWRAHSPALLAFGGDSAIELASAVVVLWRFRVNDAHEDAERRAARVAGALLFALAVLVAITSVASLLGYSEPKPTFLGIVILVAAAIVMPWLAKEKRRLSGATSSGAWYRNTHISRRGRKNSYACASSTCFRVGSRLIALPTFFCATRNSYRPCRLSQNSAVVPKK